MDYVLVIEDDPDVREFIVADLTARGWAAVGIDDLDAALELCQASPPALVVLDQIVESPESRAFLRHLDARAPGLRVIVLRYEAAPAVAFSALEVSVIAGDGWFEQLPALARRLLSGGGLGRGALAVA